MESAEGTYDNPLTDEFDHHKPTRQMKVCKCCHCGDVSRCTPWNDFYTRPGLNGLLCHGCLYDTTAPGDTPLVIVENNIPKPWRPYEPSK